MNDLQTIRELSSVRHSHLCPRQVLGARIALAGAAALGLELPRRDRGPLVFVETDGCFADGVEVAGGCTVGHRTLRVVDYGKIAAVFVDVQTEQAVRVAPRPDVRQRAYACAPHERRHYFAQLHAYQIMPQDELLSVEPVRLAMPVQAVVSRPVRTACTRCGEEIINEREAMVDGPALLSGLHLWQLLRARSCAARRAAAGRGRGQRGTGPAVSCRHISAAALGTALFESIPILLQADQCLNRGYRHGGCVRCVQARPVRAIELHDGAHGTGRCDLRGLWRVSPRLPDRRV